MAGGDRARPDIELVGRVTADMLVFHTSPEVEVRFPGGGRRDSRQVTSRRNLDTPVQPGRLYRGVVVRTRITTRLIDGP